jgi:hypothetical protein
MTLSPPDGLLDEVHGLTLACLAGEESLEEAHRLNELLLNDRAARRIYIQTIRDTYWLFRWATAETQSTDEVFNAGGSDAEFLQLAMADADLIVDSTPAICPSPFSLQSPFGAGLWSYASATGLTGLMLLVLWTWTMSPNEEIARAPLPASPSVQKNLRAEKLPELVGRITGMADCRWADPQDTLFDAATVPLGWKFALASGLVEISYDSGAKVILQGPCSYLVASSKGGFLSLGKLTARVESVTLQAANPKFQIPNPKFVVKTPTATVTDLGTEFGVEVDESGWTESQVFVGEVRITMIGANGEPTQTTTLRAGQTARCGRSEGIVRSAAPANAARFVRRIGLDLSNAVRIVEKFDGERLGAAFEQMPPGRYRIGHGVAEHQHQAPPAREWQQSRGYIRSVVTDFCRRDFLFEATFQVELRPSEKPTERHRIYFGIGDGVPNPNYFDEVGNGLILDFVVDNGQASVELCRPDADFSRAAADPDAANRCVTQVTPFHGLDPGRHRFRMWKTGKWVRFAVDADFQGEFRADFASRPIDLPAVAPLLNSTNSRLLVGTGNCDTMTVRFEELSVAYTKTANGQAALPRPPQTGPPAERPKGGARQ